MRTVRLTLSNVSFSVTAPGTSFVEQVRTGTVVVAASVLPCDDPLPHAANATTITSAPATVHLFRVRRAMRPRSPTPGRYRPRRCHDGAVSDTAFTSSPFVGAIAPITESDDEIRAALAEAEIP